MAAKPEPVEPAFVPTAGGAPVDLVEVKGGPAMSEAEAKKLE